MSAFFRSPLRNLTLYLSLTATGALFAPDARAQQTVATPEAAVTAALSAACKHEDASFATSLTADNAAAYRALPGPQRTAIMKRFVLLDEAGRPLLSAGASSHAVVRCESSGYTTEMRLGETRVRENLAFVPMEIPIPGEAPRSVTIGLVREGGSWKLLSLGLVLLDVPAMAKQWAQADLEAGEDAAIADLRSVASALENYRRAYGRLPDSLAALGPAQQGGVSPETAGLVDADLAAGSKNGYSIRYSIRPSGGNVPEDQASQADTFWLSASPLEYGKSGRRSFFLDSSGVLRGADKQGGVAVATDPRIGPS